MREVWTRYSAGQLTEDEVGQLSTLAQERRAVWRGSGQAALGLVMPPPLMRCPTPVCLHSHFKGRSEGRIWRPTNRQEVQKVLLAAKRYELALFGAGGRAQGRVDRCGPNRPLLAWSQLRPLPKTLRIVIDDSAETITTRLRTLAQRRIS